MCWKALKAFWKKKRELFWNPSQVTNQKKCLIYTASLCLVNMLCHLGNISSYNTQHWRVLGFVWGGGIWYCICVMKCTDLVKMITSHRSAPGPSSQDGGIDRYTLPPHTTRRRTTNLTTKNNQNCQEIKLYGSLTTKELKKHSFRLGRRGGDGQPGWRGHMSMLQLEDQAGEAVAGSPTFACG